MLYLIVFLVVMSLVVLCRSCYELTHFVIKRYKFERTDVFGVVKILYVSDLHENCFGKENRRLVEAILKENPDCIIIGGDLIIGKEKKVKMDVGLKFLKKIEKICPVLYNFGNHETRICETDEFQHYLKEVEKLNVILLNNKGIHLNFGGTKIYFWGVELNKECYKKGEYIVGENPFLESKQDEIKVLIAHNPNFLKEYAKWKPDYVFSGHNHGGIVRLPVVNGVISTDKKLFPKYSYGIYQESQTTMILSGGAGAHTIKFRLFNESEIVVVQIVEDRKNNRNNV